MKLYYSEGENKVAFFEIEDNLTLPCNVNITSGAGHIVGTPAESLVIFDDAKTALQSVVDAIASDKNDAEISVVNDYLSAHDYFNARMRYKWSGVVIESQTDSDVYSLALKSHLVENDLISDDNFVGTLFKQDITFLCDYGMRVSKSEKNVSGNRWKTAIRAFFHGVTGDALRDSVKDDYVLPETKAWEDYSITKERMEFLRGCYPTSHALAKDTFSTSVNKRRFVNVLLSTDATLAAKKKA